MPRIHVIGSGGAGKTVLASQLAAALDVPHFELDSLFWQENWQKPEVEDFQQTVSQVLSAEDWVTDGNYSAAREIVWGRVEVVVWLDYPLWLVMLRLIRRSIKRAFRRDLLWGTNRESLSKLFLSRDSLLLYVLRTHKTRQTLYQQLSQSPEFSEIEFVRLRSPRQTEQWVEDYISSPELSAG